MNLKKYIYLVFSVIAALGILIYLSLILQTFKIFSFSLLSIILIAFFIIVWKYTNKILAINKENKTRLIIITSVLSVLISFSYIYGAILEKSIEQKAYFTLIEILALSMSIMPIIIITFLKLSNSSLKSKGKGLVSIDKRKLTRRQIIIIIIVWLIGYLALWPGVYGYDAAQWIKTYIQSQEITTHFSPFYVGIFALLVNIGVKVFDSYTIGFGIFSFVQMSFIIFCVYKILKYLNKYFNKNISIIVTCFFCIIPTHLIIAVSSAQDAAFMGIFALIAIKIMEMSINPEEYWKNKKNSLYFIFLTFIFCIVRNNGIYVILFLTVFSFLYIFGYRRKLFSCLIIVIALYYIYAGPILNLFNISKSPNSLKEMMSVPVMQLNRAYIYNEEAFSEEDKELYLQYIDENAIEYYKLVPEISDNQKGALNTDLIKENPLKFLKLYIKIGIKDIRDYIKAPLLNMLGLWYPDKQYYDTRMYHPYIEAWCLDPEYLHEINKEYVEINRHSLVPIYNKAIGLLFGSKAEYGYSEWKMLFNDIPIFSTICKSGIYFIINLLLIGYLIYIKNKRISMLIFFEIGLMLTIFLGPVLLYRYMSPIIFSAPIWISTFFIKWETVKRK